MLKVGVVFGGKSSEHSISIMSGCSIVKNLNRLKYEVIPIFIDKEGNWYEVLDDIRNLPNYKLGYGLSIGSVCSQMLGIFYFNIYIRR